MKRDRRVAKEALEARTTRIIRCVTSRNPWLFPKRKKRNKPAEKLTRKSSVLCKNLIVSCFLLFLNIVLRYTPLSVHYISNSPFFTGDTA